MKLHRVLFPPSPSSSYPLPYFLKSFNKGARTGLTSCRCNMVNYSGWCVTIRRRLTGEDDIQLELGVFWNIHISSRNLGTQLFKNEVVRLILICFGWKVSPYLELQRKWYRQGREWGRIRVSSSNDTVTSIESSVKMATRDQRTRWWKNRNTWIWKKKEPKDRRNMNTTIQDASGYNQRGLLCSITGVSETQKACLKRYSEK